MASTQKRAIIVRFTTRVLPDSKRESLTRFGAIVRVASAADLEHFACLSPPLPPSPPRRGRPRAAALAPPPGPSRCSSPCHCQGVAARPVAARRAQGEAGLRPFRLRQSGRAQGRHRAAGRDGHLRQFQPRRRQCPRQPRRRHRPDLRHADDVLARRGRHRLWPAGRGGVLSGGLLLRQLPPPARGALARRPAGDGRGRDLVVRGVAQDLADLSALLPPCEIGREDRPARGDLHLRRARQPRAAADRRRVPGDAQALVGGHRRLGQQARHHRHHAGVPARLRRLPHQVGRARPHHRL